MFSRLIMRVGVLIYILFVFAPILRGQALSIFIYDEETLQGIPFVKAINERNEVFEADFNGILLLDSSNKLEFRHFEYFKVSYSLDRIKKNGYRVALKTNSNSMDEIVLSASRFKEKKKDVAQKIHVIRSQDLQHMNQSSMADVLSNSGNVFVQKSQLGGGSPIIRGFETNKVLLVVDGVRMNNAIYRGGHLQNVITLDNAIMDRVEVLYGSGSVVYGSDAIGGVMSFTTKDPLFSSTKDKVLVKGAAFGRYFSAANGYSTNANITVARRNISSLTSLSFSKFNDLRQGARRSSISEGFGERTWYVEQINGVDSMITNEDINLQIGSGYSQIDLLQKFILKKGEEIQHKLNIQLSTSSNVDRYDRLTQISDGLPKFAEWYYGPQFRFLLAYGVDLKKKTTFYDLAKITVAYQNIEESRMDRRFKKELLNNRIENLNILTSNMDFFKKIGVHELRYGIDGFYNHVSSSAFQKNIKVDTIGALDTRYPDGGSDMWSLALFGTHTWEISDYLILNDGLRFNYVGLNARFIDKTFFPFTFDEIHQSHNAVNGNLGLIILPMDRVRFTLNGSTGFRAPNIDDLTKVFESVPGKVIVPNPLLNAEYSYTTDLGLSYSFTKSIHASANAYYTLLNNALTVAKGSFNGQDSIFYDGEMSEVFTTVNEGKAFVTGVEGSFFGKINDHFGLAATLNYTYGRIVLQRASINGKDSLTPLDHIPPFFGKFSFSYNKNRFKSEFFIHYSGWKYLKDYNLNGEDNYAFALPDGMPAWYTLNIRLSYVLNKFLNLQMACENILDRNYRNFASNISAPGRNFIVTIRGTF